MPTQLPIRAEISVPIKTEYEYEYHWSFAEYTPMILITISVIVAIEIVFKFFILARKRKKIEKVLEKRFQDLDKEEEIVFWGFLGRKIRELGE